MIAMGREPIIDPGLCRFCGALTRCRVLNEKYQNMGRTEIYSKMIMNCFGIELSHLTSKTIERLVCMQCVNKLRQSLNFKMEVMQSELTSLQSHVHGSKHEMLKSKPVICTVTSPEFTTEWTEADELDVSTMSDGFDDDLNAEQLIEYKSLEDELHIQSRLAKPLLLKNRDKQYFDTGQNDYELDNSAGCSSNDGLPSLGEENNSLRKKGSNIKCGLRKRRKTLEPNVKCANVKQRRKPDARTAITDPFMQSSNISSIVKYSFACPFKNRFNHILCHYCDQYFLDPALLREHFLAHDPKVFKPTRYRYTKLDLTRIDCRLCHQKIDDLEDFKRHLVNIHKKNYFQESKDCVLPFKLVENIHKCILCHEDFTHFYGLYKHMNQHYSNYMCETCGIGFMDEISLQKHVPSHDGKRYPCNTCGNTFKSEYTRTCHIRRIHKKDVEGTFCTKCDAYVLLSEKTKHMSEVHGEPLTLPCMGCDQVFNSRRLLTIHMRREHMKDYRYECQICHARFFRRSSLTFHMPRHTGAREHQCAVCLKRYPRVKTLLEHMKIHNNVRRYRCHICGQAFVQNCSLKGHMRRKHPEYG